MHTPCPGEWCLYVLMQQQKVHGLLGRKKKKERDRKTGLWQKTALMTERDLSIAWTIPIPRPVIMGFITQPCTSLILSLHLSLSARTCAPTGTHSHGVRHQEEGDELQTGYMTTLASFFCNLLKEMYASKQNVVNPQAWLFGLWERNKTVVSRSNAKTQQQRNVKGDFNHRLCLGCLWRVTSTDSYNGTQSTHSFYSFKSSLHIQPAWTVFEISKGAS